GDGDRWYREAAVVGAGRGHAGVQGVPLPQDVLAPMTKLVLKKTTDDDSSAFAYAERVTRAQGFTRPGVPGHRAPMVPMDLGELPPDEVMNLFAEFSAWAGYAAVRVAEAEAIQHDVESYLKVAEAKYMIDESKG